MTAKMLAPELFRPPVDLPGIPSLIDAHYKPYSYSSLSGTP
jgi:hypothetical protein